MAKIGRRQGEKPQKKKKSPKKGKPKKDEKNATSLLKPKRDRDILSIDSTEERPKRKMIADACENDIERRRRGILPIRRRPRRFALWSMIGVLEKRGEAKGRQQDLSITK